MHELRDPVSQLSRSYRRNTAYLVPKHLVVAKRNKTVHIGSKRAYLKSTVNFPILPLKTPSSPFPVIKTTSFELCICSLLNSGQ